MRASLSPERAEILGLDALTWLAAEPEGLARFLDASGVSGAELRAQAGSAGLSLAVLDFLLSHEELLLGFCQNSGTDPALVHRARHLLQPEAG
jgi:hypothetical protein